MYVRCNESGLRTQSGYVNRREASHQWRSEGALHVRRARVLDEVRLITVVQLLTLEAEFTILCTHTHTHTLVLPPTQGRIELRPTVQARTLTRGRRAVAERPPIDFTALDFASNRGPGPVSFYKLELHYTRYIR